MQAERFACHHDRPVLPPHARTVREQCIFVSHIGVSVKGEGGHGESPLHCPAVQGLDILQDMAELQVACLELPCRKRIKHEGIVRIRTMPHLNYLSRFSAHGSQLLNPLQQHPWPLAPRLPRRPCAVAYGLGPSVFTLRATKRGTERASVSQPAACRGTPPLPACRSGPAGAVFVLSAVLPPQADPARGAKPEEGGIWFASGRGPTAGAQRRWGWPSLAPVVTCCA
jgi:hypothetical protein